jgi:wee1-like protein kinase
MRQLFEQPAGLIQPPPTPILSRSSAPLSSSNTSLFKPIRAGSSSVGTANVFTHHFQAQHQRAGSYTCSNSCPNNSAHNSTCTFSHAIRSPHSPFQFNQLQANINPFTPTFDNSKLTSASNAANMVKLAVANLNSTAGTPGIRKQATVDCAASLTRTKTQLSSLSSSLQQLPTTSTSTKRCYEIELNVNSTTPNESLNQSVNNNNNNNNEDENLNSSLSNKNADEHSNSLPRNKRLALRQCLVSRYHEEFHEVCKLGSGEFGDVFKCINRLDGCTYAIKRSKKPIAGSALEVAAWKEVCAHAVLVKHNHIVQYYSAWAEADRMLIQNEYCNGGSLAEFIESLRMNNGEMQETSSPNTSNQLMMNEADLKILLLHIAKGLAYMHSLNLVHLDIKPGNVFICRSPRRHLNLEAVSGDGLVKGRGINEESGIDSDDMDEGEGAAMPVAASSTASLFSEVITYKIGDLGHVTSTLEPHVEEGDCRYLPNEILQEQYDQLPKADVFALALTVFVCGSLEELPKNGDEWHWIRRGNLKDLGQCSERFRKLLLVSGGLVN